MKIQKYNLNPKLKSIEFRLIDPVLKEIPKPSPALKSLPNWYKNMPPYTNGDKEHIVQNKQTNLTLKKCVPFLDALGAGYFIPLPADVQVSQTPGGPRVTWLSQFDIVTEHSDSQLPNIEIPEGYNKHAFKWSNPWVVKTPKGYSSLFINPINRNDLPFYSFAGIVDTDEYSLPVNLPFLIKDKFNGTIESGTPIIQVIPFKRDSWTTVFTEAESILEYNQNIFDFSSKLKHYYRDKFWKRKEYR